MVYPDRRDTMKSFHAVSRVFPIFVRFTRAGKYAYTYEYSRHTDSWVVSFDLIGDTKYTHRKKKIVSKYHERKIFDAICLEWFVRTGETL